MNRAKKRVLSDGASAPDVNEEYLLYQTLVGTLPFRFDEESADYIARIQQYMTKALHEAKVNLSWINPNPEYTGAVNEFIARLLAPGAASTPCECIQYVPIAPATTVRRIPTRITSSFTPPISLRCVSMTLSLLSRDVPRLADRVTRSARCGRRPADTQSNARATSATCDRDAGM